MTDTTTDLPAPLREHLYALVGRLVDYDGLLVALDFDGTLAAIERRPDEVAIPDATREALTALAADPNTEVAIVSGRELADVRERVGVDADSVSYAGNHGLELHADEYEVHPDAREAEATVSRLADRLADRLAHVEGALVEDKGVTATVHYRLVAADDVPAVENAVASLVDPHEDVRLTTGKDVLELRPAVEWDKGDAVGYLHEELVPEGQQWFATYVGDDTTDEAAFGVLGDRGLGVKVGEDPDTDAGYRVADPDAVRAILDWLGTYGTTFLDADHRDVPVGSA